MRAVNMTSVSDVTCPIEPTTPRSAVFRRAWHGGDGGSGMDHSQRQRADAACAGVRLLCCLDLCGKPLHKLLHVLSKKAQHKGKGIRFGRQS